MIKTKTHIDYKYLMKIPEFLHQQWPMNQFLQIRKQIPKNVSMILDVGCGDGSTMAKIKKPVNSLVVGVDIFRPYLIRGKMLNLYHSLIICDIRQLPFRRKTFDIILLLDVLEHLTKEDGEQLIKHLERIACKKVIIFTPVGFVSQESLDENIFQRHKSGWTTRELKKRKYTVRGSNGLGFLRSECAQIRFSGILTFFAVLISHLSDPFVYLAPRFAFHMLCVKNID